MSAHTFGALVLFSILVSPALWLVIYSKAPLWLRCLVAVALAALLLWVSSTVTRALSPPKFFPEVTASGIYQTHNRLRLEWADDRWHAARGPCVARAVEIAKSVKSLTGWMGVKLERNPVPSCVEK